jgi:RNA polymerase sigma-70 factor (ECF subfamily)
VERGISLTEQDLVAAARDGDDNAFKELVRRFEPAVAATVIGMLGDCPEAEDVGQETFVRFYRSLNQFRGESSLKTYLTRIAMNLSLNELRRRKRWWGLFSTRPVEEYFDLPGEKPGYGESEETELIRKAIQRLDDKFRAVIVLRLIEGHSAEETAEILGVPVGTVSSRLARAQEKLRRMLIPILGERS